MEKRRSSEYQSWDESVTSSWDYGTDGGEGSHCTAQDSLVTCVCINQCAGKCVRGMRGTGIIAPSLGISPSLAVVLDPGQLLA